MLFSAESMFKIQDYRWPWCCIRQQCSTTSSSVTELFVKSLKLHMCQYIPLKFSDCTNLTWPSDFLFLVTVPEGKVA